MHAYTGTHKSALIEGRTAEVWPSGFTSIFQDGEFLYETRIGKEISELDLEAVMAADDADGRLSPANTRLFNILCQAQPKKGSRWDQVVWVPVSKVDEIEVALGDARRIAREMNTYRETVRGGYSFDAHRMIRVMREGLLAEFEITLKEAGVITDWYTRNVYRPNDMSTLI